MQRFSLFLSADNSVKLRSSYWQMCYIYEAYVYLGIAKDGEPLTIVLKDAAGQQNTMTAAAMTYDEMSSSDFVTMKSMRTRAAATDYDKSKTYFSLPLTRAYITFNIISATGQESAMRTCRAGFRRPLQGRLQAYPCGHAK